MMASESPAVYTALVDAAFVESLFAGVESGCSAVSARIRERNRSAASGATTTLARARLALDGCAAVQLRYVHDGIAWSDTLQVVPEGYRLIRCQLGEP